MSPKLCGYLKRQLTHTSVTPVIPAKAGIHLPQSPVYHCHFHLFVVGQHPMAPLQSGLWVSTRNRYTREIVFLPRFLILGLRLQSIATTKAMAWSWVWERLSDHCVKPSSLANRAAAPCN